MFWELLATIIWLSLGAYGAWYFFKAEVLQPLALEDLVLAFEIHKKMTKCPSQRAHTLFVKDRGIVGFQCDCGYQYLQKKLRFQKILKNKRIALPHKTHYKLSNLFETKNRLKELGLEYYKIKMI